MADIQRGVTLKSFKPGHLVVKVTANEDCKRHVGRIRCCEYGSTTIAITVPRQGTLSAFIIAKLQRKPWALSVGHSTVILS